MRSAARPPPSGGEGRGCSEKRLINYFEVLGIPESTTDDREVKRAYRVKAKLHHSDRGGNDLVMGRINYAYEVLQKQEGRRSHLAELRKSGTARTAGYRWRTTPGSAGTWDGWPSRGWAPDSRGSDYWGTTTSRSRSSCYSPQSPSSPPPAPEQTREYVSKSVAAFEGILGAIKGACYCGLGTLFVLCFVQTHAAWLSVVAIRLLAVIGAAVGAGIGYAFAYARTMSGEVTDPSE